MSNNQKIASTTAPARSFTAFDFDSTPIRRIFAPTMAYEASFTGALRIIFWIVMVSFAIRLIARMAMPYVVRKSEDVLRQRMADFQNQQRQQSQRQTTRSEGEITVESGKPPKDDGEFTDYVEIKE